MTKNHVLCAVVVSVCCGLSLGTTYAADDTWMTDFEEAKRISAEKGMPILADFTGSDWCGYCIKLDKEVFSKQEFKDFAKDNVVLFVADFPRNKPQSEKVTRQNIALQRKYNIRGFPTVLILDDGGKVLGYTGYERGGPAKYVENLKNIIGDSGIEPVVAKHVEPKAEVKPAEAETVKVAVEKQTASSEDVSLGKWFSDLFK